MFNDEKRLDALAQTALFREDRLSLADLRCFTVAEPLGWQRGRQPQGPVIVLENLSTWHSYMRWDQDHPGFSAIVYGGGLRFIDAVPFLHRIFAELGDGPRPILYFGDLDAPGLRIPRRASLRARAVGLPAVEPHIDSYRWLLGMISRATSAEPAEPVDPPDASPDPPDDCAWLGELAPEARRLIASGQRLAQEHVGHEFLVTAFTGHSVPNHDPCLSAPS